MSESSNIITFGCRLNFSESQIIHDNLKKLNRDDVIVVHSCSVTKNADKESMSKVRELIQKHKNDGKKIFVTGCSAQLDPDKYLALGADRVIGNEDKLKIDSYLDSKDKKIWTDMSTARKIENLPKTTILEGKTRGLIQIQNGCDHDCTFCVIYKARGKNRSVPLNEIFEQLRILIENNYREIVFTGVDITDYGKDFTEHNINLAKLIKKTLALFPQIERLRLSSIDVAEIDDELLTLLASETRIMPYIHISMQSGSDLILKRMKRRHLSKDIRNFCFNLLERRPEVVFGADIITGFPTETEELFQETMNLLNEIPNFTHLHIFPFSAHSGTPAARMPQVNGKIIKERARILRELNHKKRLEFLENILKSDEKNILEQNVLYETNNIGKTSQFFKVKLLKEKNINDENLIGKILKTRLVSIERDERNSLQPFYLIGEII